MKKTALVATSILTMTLFHAANAQATDSDQRKSDRRGPPPFEKLDLDGDNGISLEEFSQHRIPHGDHDTVFGFIDSNADGMISQEELRSHKPPRRNRKAMQDS